jgi:hypothetical protein
LWALALMPAAKGEIQRHLLSHGLDFVDRAT